MATVGFGATAGALGNEVQEATMHAITLVATREFARFIRGTVLLLSHIFLMKTIVDASLFIGCALFHFFTRKHEDLSFFRHIAGETKPQRRVQKVLAFRRLVPYTLGLCIAAIRFCSDFDHRPRPRSSFDPFGSLLNRNTVGADVGAPLDSPPMRVLLPFPIADGVPFCDWRIAPHCARPSEWSRRKKCNDDEI
jgi:hypothetical protein